MANATEFRNLYYDGSTLLMPLSVKINIPLDQVSIKSLLKYYALLMQ